jgi:hypothetical protein
MSFLRMGPGSAAQSFWTGAGALWVFSAAISAMNPPASGNAGFYGWLYRFTHLLAANLDRALGPALQEHAPDQQATDISNQEKQ